VLQNTESVKRAFTKADDLQIWNFVYVALQQLSGEKFVVNNDAF
jgi:hypothetical protein